MLRPCLFWFVAFTFCAASADAGRRRRRKPPPPPPAAAPEPIPTPEPTPPPAEPPVAEPKRPVATGLRIAVGTLAAPDLDESERLGLEEAISLEIQRISPAEVVSISDVRAFLSLVQQQQIVGCDSSDCMTELGAALSAQQLVAGSVRKVDEGWVVSLQRSDLVNQTVLERSSQEADDSGRALMQAARRAVPPLFGVVGRIVVWNQPERAELYIDDRWVGLTPIDAVPVKHPGEHRVSITGAGLTSWEAVIAVEAGADARVRALNRSIAMLEAEASSTRSTGWWLVAGGVATAAAAGATWLLAVRNDNRLDKVDLRTLSQSEIDGITSTTVNLTVVASLLSATAAALLGTGTWTLATNNAQDLLDAQ